MHLFNGDRRIVHHFRPIADIWTPFVGCLTIWVHYVVMEITATMKNRPDSILGDILGRLPGQNVKVTISDDTNKK